MWEMQMQRTPRMRCQSCEEEYKEQEAGTCKECYEEASETEEELKREIESLKSKISFLRLSIDPFLPNSNADLLLHGVSQSQDAAADNNSTLSPAVPAHRAVLISRSPVFKAMLETEMEENKSGMIKIYDVSYEVLRSFVKYLYTAEVLLDVQMACDLLVLAEKYQVKHLKSYCEKFMTSKVNNENAIVSYAFAHQHQAKQLIEAALSSILENMSTLTEREDYKELLDRDPRLVVEIYEAYLTRQANTAEK